MSWTWGPSLKDAVLQLLHGIIYNYKYHVYIYNFMANGVLQFAQITKQNFK